jgi:L-2-hydroxyglutarate oxidase
MTYDICIIGGGIVGLATAMKLLERKPSLRLCLLEKENELASHQTGNNSGVIHSGIYYKPGSYKALNCIKGYKYLLDFCEQNNIAYDLCGKLIIAVNKSELPALDNLYNRGTDNGLKLIRRLNNEELKGFEP